MENKNSYFCLTLRPTEDLKDSPGFNKQLNDATDHILYSIGTDPQSVKNYKIKKIDNSEQIFIFRTNNRKRQGQLNKYCERFLHPTWNVKYTTRGLGVSEVPAIVEKFRNDKSYQIEGELPYTGRDIKIFDDVKNWHPWQRDIYNIMFESNGTLKIPDDREIINLIDYAGNSGKSSFWKYLYVNHRDKIGRISYGTASQLRSQSTKIGKKPIFIIDLSRTKGFNDKEEDLLSVCEEIKSGLVTSGMGGNNSELIMDPPFVIISSNYTFEKNSLSEDRWSIYEITKNKTLGKRNELLKKIKKKDNLKK